MRARTSSKRSVLPLLAALAAVATHVSPDAAAASGERPARDFAVRAGRVITMQGADLVPGVVVVRDRRFAAVGGPDTRVPEGMPVIDASDRVLMPGFVEAHSSRGLDRTVETAADASFVRVSDGLNPVSLEIEDARRNGITTLLVAPDERGFVSGRAAIVHPQGLSIDNMIVKQDAALKISLKPQGGASRMGHLAKLRSLLDETRRAMERREREAARGEETEIPPEQEALVALLEDEIPAFVHCATAADVATAFSLAAQHEFHVVPILEPEAWRAVDLVRTNHVRVIVTPRMETWERRPDGSVVHVHLPRRLAEAGVPFALTTDPRELGAQHPWYQAALAVRGGVPRETALAAVTKVPSAILGFGRSKGVIAEGADADFVLLTDDPFSATTWVDEAYVRGARIYDRESDEKLRRLLSRGDEPPIMAPESDHPGPREELERERREQLESPPSLEDAERRLRWPAPVGGDEDDEHHHHGGHAAEGAE